MNTETLKKIKSELPTGAITEIAIKSGASKGTVKKFFDGKSSNVRVLQAVSEVYGGYKKSVSELMTLAQA